MSKKDEALAARPAQQREKSLEEIWSEGASTESVEAVIKGLQQLAGHNKRVQAKQRALAEQQAISAGPITPAMKAVLTTEQKRALLAMNKDEQPHKQQEPVARIEHDDETAEPCPSCGKPLQLALGGGVVCSGRCGYWFCF